MNTPARRLLAAVVAAALPVFVANACSDESSSGTAGTTTGTGGSDTTSTGGGTGTGGNGTAGNGTAGNGVAGHGPCGTTQCTNCIDDDGDGQIDAWDVECSGPLDDDEGSFATGIPGDNSDPCKQDCFFDGNSGSGNDGCLWNLACDPANPGAPECPYDPNKNNCPPPPDDKCIENCMGLTPNGCDCFGCCEVTLADKSTVTILLGPGCTEETAKDPTFCKPCTQQVGCLNPCEPCEYCLGKTTLPPECTPDGGSGGNDGGTGGGGQCSPCAPEFPCPAGEYCLTGCCIPQ